MKNPKARTHPTPKLGGDVPPEAQEFVDKNKAFFEKDDATMAEVEAIIEQALAAAEKYKIDRAVFLRALILAIQHMNERQVDLKSKIATWTQRLAKITSVATVVALLFVGGVAYFSSLHPPQEVAGQNFTQGSVS